MTERVLSGVKVPLVGDDEKMHRAIERAVSDLKKLRTEIATTGVATEKQSRSVEDLEIRISSMLQQQEKSTSLYGASSSQLGKLREKVSATAGAMAGLTSQFGSAGGAIGRVGSIATQAFGAFAVGGPIALGVAAVGAAISYAVSASAEQEAAFQAASDAADKHGASMRRLNAQIKAVGKSSVETARLVAEAAAVEATTEYLRGPGAASINRQAEIEAEIEAWRRSGQTGIAIENRINKLRNESLDLQIEQRKAIQRINEAYEKTIELAKKQRDVEKTKKDEQAAMAASTIAALTKEMDLLSQGIGGVGFMTSTSMIGQSLLLPNETVQSWNRLLDAMEGVAKMAADIDTHGNQLKVSLASPAALGGPMGPVRMRDSWTKAQVEQHDFEKSLIKASEKGGLRFAHAAMNSLLSSGSPFAGAGGIAAGIASNVANTIADALKQGFNALASAVGTGIDFIAGSSKFGGIGGKAAQTAGSVFAGHMALGMAAGPLAAVTGGPVRGAALAAGAGVAATLPEVMMRATTETESYAKSMRAFDGIFRSITAAMEPVFDSFLPSIGLAGMLIRNLAQTLAPMNAALGDTMGRLLFTSMKTAAMGAINVAIALDSMHIGVMRGANAINWLAYTTFQNLGLYEQAGTALENYNIGVAALNTQISRHLELTGIREEIAGTEIKQGRVFADHLSRLGQETDTLADGFSAVSSSMRNIPDFFNAARARRDASYDGDLGPVNDWRNDPGVNPAFADAPGMASGGFTVEAGGLFVAQMIVQSDNIQRINQQARYAAYASGSRSSGSSMPSKNNGYGGGGDFG